MVDHAELSCSPPFCFGTPRCRRPVVYNFRLSCGAVVYNSFGPCWPVVLWAEVSSIAGIDKSGLGSLKPLRLCALLPISCKRSLIGLTLPVYPLTRCLSKLWITCHLSCLGSGFGFSKPFRCWPKGGVRSASGRSGAARRWGPAFGARSARVRACWRNVTPKHNGNSASSAARISERMKARWCGWK